MRKISLILWFSCILTSCAFKNMIYQHLDTVVMYQIDSYLDLRSDQEKAIEGPVQETVEWIKKEKLKEVVALVDKLAEAAGKRAIDATLIDEVFQRFGLWRAELTAKLAKPAAKLVQSLDERQIGYLEKKLRKSNRKLEDLLGEKPADFQEELDDYSDDQMKRFKSWYGRFSPEQKAIYIQSIRPDRARIEQQLAIRKDSQDAWLKIIRERNEEKTLKVIESWGKSDPGEGLNAKQQQFRTESRQQWRDFWIALHKNLSEEQWKQLQKKLEETSQDLTGILRKQAA